MDADGSSNSLDPNLTFDFALERIADQAKENFILGCLVKQREQEMSEMMERYEEERERLLAQTDPKKEGKDDG